MTGRRVTEGRCPHSGHGDDGVATVLAIVLSGALAALALVASGVVALVDAHRRAEAAADLAALAGAQALAHGAAPCPAAARVAGANHAAVVGCSVRGQAVSVVAAVRAPAPLGMVPDLRARARAGPVAPPGLGTRGAVRSGEQHVQQPNRAGLVQGAVLVAALG